MSDAMAIWQCFPWTEMIYPKLIGHAAKEDDFFPFEN